jgi:hypothetical protein
MTFKKIALALTLSFASGSVALATQFDGDNNAVPGTQIETQHVFADTFASARVPAMRTRVVSVIKRMEIDGDGNPVPGWH